MDILSKNQRNSQSQTCDRAECDRIVPRSQQAVFGAKLSAKPSISRVDSQDPLLALYATSSVCKQPNGRRWWNIRCQFNHRFFSGLCLIAERNRILEIFNGTTSQITPQEFELVAERIIFETAQIQGAAS